jgi:membrane protein YqaA with SNARE-associated domain
VDDLIAYGGLFLFSLAAATILPFPSEAALVGLVLADYSPWLLLVAASTGNVLGAAINLLLGRAIDRYGTRQLASGTLSGRTRAERGFPDRRRSHPYQRSFVAFHLASQLASAFKRQ